MDRSSVSTEATVIRYHYDSHQQLQTHMTDFINAYILGYRNLDADRLVIADMIGLSGSKRVLYYEIFEVLPSLLVGARGAASLCLVLVVVAEMFVGGDGGLGRVIQDMRYSDDIPTLYGAIIVSGLVGYIMNLMFIAAEMRIVRFMGKS